MMEDPDRATALDIVTHLRVMHDKVEAETWTDERAKASFLTGVRASIAIIDQDYLKGE